MFVVYGDIAKNNIFVESINYMRPQIVKYILFIYAHFFVMGVAVAQERVPPPPQPERTPGPQLPIDNHILILIIFGVFLGAYFLLRKKKANL